MQKGGAVYIMANSPNGTIYIGVTSNLPLRNYQHKNGIYQGFTDKYQCKLLVWYEWYETIENAILREKQLKRWNRGWKIRLIEQTNPKWRDKTPNLSL